MQYIPGITQAQVDSAPTFPKVLQLFYQWLTSQIANLKTQRPITICPLTCGDWDLMTMFPSQCKLSNIPTPHPLAKNWINIKTEFERLANIFIEKDENDLMQMMREFGLEHEGKLHSGIDDTKNMVKVVKELVKRDTLKPRHDKIYVFNESDFVLEQISKDVEMKEEEKLPDFRDVLKQNPNIKLQKYKLILILNLKVTCLKDQNINPEEIILFQCSALDLESSKIVKTFNKYVKPIHKPKLSPFCIKATKITQSMVNQAPEFRTVFSEFQIWINNLGESNWILASSGDWPIKTSFQKQLKLCYIHETPSYLKQWINIKNVFTKSTGLKIAFGTDVSDVEQMVRALGLEHVDKEDEMAMMAEIVMVLARLTSLEITSKG